MLLVPVSAPPRESRSNPYVGSVLEYGIVLEAYSTDHTVRLRMMNGQILPRCKVMPKEWVAPNPDKARKESGRRSLPPVNCRVVVLKPFHSYDGALVIGSDFVYDKSYTQDDFSAKDKEREDYHVTPGGWAITEKRDDGTILIARDDTRLTIQDDGSGGLSIEDANGNKFELTNGGVAITDKNGNVIEMVATSVKINNNLEVLQ
jgi:hypothetical protein